MESEERERERAMHINIERYSNVPAQAQTRSLHIAYQWRKDDLFEHNDQFDGIITRMNGKLFKAAASGNVEYLSQNEVHRLDLDQALTPQDNNVLHIAVKAKQKEFAKQVIDLCPSLLFKPNLKGDSPLHLAASIGCLELVELLISNAKLLGEDVESQGHHVINGVKVLLRMANFEMKETAMHIGLRKGHIGVVRLLMEADIGLLDLVTSADESPLYLAVLGGFTDLVKHILESCPSSPCGGPKGTNALHAALYQKGYGNIKIVAEQRADIIKEADMIGWTPIHYAAYYGNLGAVELLLQFDSSAAYLSDKEGTCPLHIAAFNGFVEIATELIKCCPYIWESQDKKGRTALHAAVIGGQQKFVQCILEVPDLGCWLINEPDKDGNTPLHMAVLCGNHRMISVLARHEGVDKIAMNKELLTAMDIFDIQQEKTLFEYVKLRHLLKRYGLPYIQRWIDTKYTKSLKGDHLITKKEDEEEEKKRVTPKVEGSGDSSRSMFETHLLVAVLIATVTFAAVFTMPGGYKEDGPDQGMPNFIHKVGFKAFVIFDTIAFASSATTVYLLFYCSSYKKRHHIAVLAIFFIIVAMVGMALAFLTAMYLLLAKSIGLVITVFVMGGCFIVTIFVYWFLDPRGNYCPGLTWSRRYLRNILFDHGML